MAQIPSKAVLIQSEGGILKVLMTERRLPYIPLMANRLAVPLVVMAPPS